MKHTKKAIYLGIGILCVTALALYLTIQSIEPSFRNVQYKIEGEREWTKTVHPITFKTESKASIHVQLEMKPSWLRIAQYQINGDDCLQSIIINGKLLEDNRLPSCDFRKRLSFDLGPYLQPGYNTINAQLLNRGGSAQFLLEASNLYFSIFILIYAIIMLYYIVRIFRYFKKAAYIKWTLIIGLLGIILRFLYLSKTSYVTRGHDTIGHLHYIQYMAENLLLPPLKGGWQAYHPPLYYFFSGLWFRVGLTMERAENLLILDLQLIACILSVLTFVIGIWIASLLFSEKKDQKKNLLLIAVLAVFPGVIYFASRINNDVLLQVFMFFSLALILHWWKKGGIYYWLLAIAFACLGILTKLNALLLLPIAYLCLLFYKKYRLRKKVALGIAGLFLIFIMTGWLFALRFGAEGQKYIVGNANGLNPKLYISNEIELYTEFNPIRIVKQPYNHQWEKEGSREYFFEYLYRSAFVGEFKFGKNLQPFVSFILLQGLFLLAIMFIGLFRSMQNSRRETMPMFLTLFVLIAGHLAFRHIPPSASPGQDFRYSFLVIIPCTYFVLIGLDALPKLLRTLATVLLYLFITSCAIFIILIDIW